MQLSLLAQRMRQEDRDRFLAGLFVPARLREGVYALCAMGRELDGIRKAVREEMIFHIRHAWWEEALTALYAGRGRMGHPVMEGLAAAGELPRELIGQLAQLQRGHFSENPPQADEKLDAVIHAYLELHDARAASGWRKARGIEHAHRARYGKERSFFLTVKLLIAGL